MTAAVVIDVISIVLLIATAYVKGRRDGHLAESRRKLDTGHIERVQRQIRAGALRTYDMRPPWVTIIPKQKGSASDD